VKMKLWIYENHIFELRNEEINVKKILAVINATYAEKREDWRLSDNNNPTVPRGSSVRKVQKTTRRKENLCQNAGESCPESPSPGNKTTWTGPVIVIQWQQIPGTPKK